MSQDNIRNFAIIAHIDHGKSTLADRLLEKTKTIAQDKMREQFLDQNPISRERGITIKLAPVRMNYKINEENFIFNLIDTPGHVDFSYEVSRTLAACEGAILLVDATQGVQAQTVAHYYAAIKENLSIIPVINKIDLPTARTEEVEKQISEMFSFTREEILQISAKTGHNLELLLETIINKIPPPKGNRELPLKALIFDAYYDNHQGVIIYVRLIDGSISKSEKIHFFQSELITAATQVGHFTPFLEEKKELIAGEIGYVVTGVKDIRKTGVGDTVFIKEGTKPLPGYLKPKPMVFFGMYPKIPAELGKLKLALEKVSLNDTSLSFSEEYSSFLGSGFRVGFLGLLHAEIIKERLQNEESLDILLTMPHVLYQEENGKTLEPYILLTVYIPKDYVGNVINLCETKKGKLIDLTYILNSAVVKYEIPYTMLIRGLSSDLKSMTSGFASIDYELSGFKEADLVELEIRINNTTIDVLSEKVYKDEALSLAREKTKKLKESLPRQQFRQVIQALINANIVSREEVAPFRKDVLAKMSGGDRTRKDKLLDKQKKGKSRMIEEGRVRLPQEVLYTLIKN